MRYDDVLADLRTAYDGGAAERDGLVKSDWKLAERSAFRDRLAQEGARRLLEIGAGTGQDSRYFLDEGIEVVATDLSPQMVARCRAKGIDARVADVAHLDFPAQSFDAAYAFNCLLHVPDADLPAVLERVAHVLRPGGLFFVGVFGGEAHAGPLPDDNHVPPRFFAFRTDEALQRFARAAFTIVDFHVVDPAPTQRFQSLTLRA